MAKLKAVIFDMDGVIIDSEPIHYQVNQLLYKELGIKVSDEEYSTFIGVSNSDHWTILKKKYNLSDSIEELVMRQNEGNISHLQDSDEKAIPGILELLKELEENNIKIALASSSGMKYIEAVLDKFGIDAYFSVKVSGEEMDKGKPNPDIFLEAAKRLELNPEDCLVIEDSENGVKAAKKAGMRCIGHINPNSGNQDLSLADERVDSIEKLNFNVLEKIMFV
ncbi:HAD family hydrolase [Natronospora cellulosivora (SeqCode)]